jgi:hypothetical protein
MIVALGDAYDHTTSNCYWGIDAYSPEAWSTSSVLGELDWPFTAIRPDNGNTLVSLTLGSGLWLPLHVKHEMR